jgi:glutamate formiminotransferase
MPPLESVPNVSEGRRPAVFDRLVAALSGHRGATLLDASRDADHDRAVFTLAGDAAGLRAALLDLYRVALAEIDLRFHRGVHPRVGAVDVVPFVALGGTPKAAAVAAARDLAAEVAARFDLPVYLYEEAASAPHRRALAALRRGGSEGLAARLAASLAAAGPSGGAAANPAPTPPDWRPDFGPPRLHPTAGATAIGARPLLVAANALLDSSDLEVARGVARAVRESGGGLPAVRALGLLLPSRGLGQVSMNLVDVERTPPAAAFAAVVREAARRGARVLERELIGLVPEAALAGEGEEAERLREAWGGRTLEGRLAAVAPGGRAASEAP